MKRTLLLCTLVFAMSFGIASATVTFTPATGGSAVSADTTGGGYTTLTGPVITEGAFRDFPASGTFILNAPAGFAFNTGAQVTATITRTAGTGSCFSFSATTATPTATTITFTLNARDGNPNTTRCQVAFSNIQARPTAGTPLASGNITKSGTASVAGITNGVTNLGTLTEVVGAKNQLSFTTQPSAAATTSVDFATKPVIGVHDKFGNTLTNDNASTITLTPKLSGQSCAGTNGNGILSSTPASGAAVTSGVLTYTAMQYSVAEDIQICAVSTGATSTLSSIVSVRNPVPTTTSISPTSIAAGGPQFTLTVNGTNFRTSSVVQWNGSARATTYVSASQLTATILASDIVSQGSASITVFNPTPGGGTSNAQTFTITTITPTKLVILPPGNGTTDAPVSVTIQAQNNAGQVATSWNGSVTLNKTGSATGGGLISIVNGVGTTTITDFVAETVNLTLSDTQGTGLDVSSAQSIIFSAGATKQFSLNAPGNMTAGTRLGFTVSRKDQHGNLVTSGSDVAYLYSSSADTAKRFYDAASGGNIVTSITIANGTSSAQFWYYDELAGTATITASDNAVAPDGNTGIIDATYATNILAAATSQFSLTQNTTMTAGTRLGYTVTRKDPYGNAVTAGTSTAYLYSSSADAAKKFYDAASGGNIITSVVIGSGASSAQFWYYDELAGTATITASDNAVAPDGNTGIIDATNVISVLPAVTHAFLLNNPGGMQVGTRLGYAVTRKDQFGNAVTAGTNTVYLYSNSTGAKAFYNVATGGTPVTSVTIGSGASTANFWYYDDAAGTWRVTASDNATAPDGAIGIADGTQSVAVSPAPIVATRFTIVKPADGVVGATVPVTIRAEDNSGNLATTYNNSVTLVTSGHATPQNGVVVSVVNGVGTTNISDTFAEMVTLSLIDSATTTLNVSSTQTVTFSPGATAQYILNTPGNMTAGTRLGYTVTRKDQFGNVVTAGNATVYLYSNATGGLSAFYDASSGGNLISSISIASSSSVANFWYYEGKAGAWTVSASDNATAPDGAIGIADGTRAVTVSPAATSQFLLNDPGNMTAGTRLGFTVSREDAFGNLVTAGSNTVYLYANPSVTSAFYSVATGGSPVTSIAIGSGASTANFWYYDNTAHLVTVTASDNASTPDGAIGIADASRSPTVSSAPIVATRLVILQPADAQVNTNVTVTIRAEDNGGNVDTTFTRSATLVTNGSATGGGVVNFISGVGTKLITDAVAETVTLSLLDTASTTLDVSSVKTVIFSATPPAPAAAAGGGTTAIIRSTVIFAGKVFPGAKLTVVAVGDGNIPVRQGTVAAGDGTFSIQFNGMAAGIRSFFLSVADKNGKFSQTKTYSVDVNQSLVVRDVLLPPTISFARETVTKGGFVGITGYATPGYAVQATIDGVDTGIIIIADDSGKYSIPVNTLNLSLGMHTARTHQTSTEGMTSDASIEGTFMVSTLFDSQTDLNHDGKVDSTDLSIFLSRWNSPDPAMRATVDFNGDGKLDAQDLSIFARTLNK